MDELNASNVLEFWENATVEQQRENIDRVLALVNFYTVLEMWQTTKKEIKSEKPDLIIRIIKEKQSNGKIYTSGLWRNTPQDVQEQTIEEVLQLYKSELMIRDIWRETDDSVKAFKKEVLAKALNYDEKLLKKYGIPEYIPAPSGMLGKEQVDNVILCLRLQSLGKDEAQDYTNFITKIPKIPITSLPYFFEQISEEIPENHVKLFWDSIKKDVKYMVVVDVIRQISSEELKKTIWNEFTPEMQKRKINELLRNVEVLNACYLIEITGKQVIREILEEMISVNEEKVISIWRTLSEDIQQEYFQHVMEMYNYEEARAYIWQESAEQVQRSNFQKCLQEKNNDTDKIIDMIRSTKLPRVEIIDYISQEYQGEQLEEIISKIYLGLFDVPSLEALKGKISPQTSVKLVIKNASELSAEKLEELSKSFNIASIQMRDDNLDYSQKEPYDVETYKKCRATIDELLEGIDLSQNLYVDDREKYIFGEVIKRLANHISYDYETLEKEKNRRKHRREYLKESTICRNLVGGLLNNTCVCAGYAEIARNVFACCGIEVRYISGNNIDPKEAGHAWNQIKLDGIWYNMDLTWDRDNIIAELPTRYSLKSDINFYGHSEYDTKRCKKEECSQTISYEEMEWYLYGKLEMPKPINDSIRRTRIRRVEEAYNMIAASQALSLEGPEKREEQWTN